MAVAVQNQKFSILIRLNYVPKIFQKQDLAVAKARVVVIQAQRLLQIIRDNVLIVHLYFYVNISGELEVGLLFQLLHFTFCLTKIKLSIISSPIIFISHGRTSGIVHYILFS
jgi:hypothetical protein